jgi:glycosyltransferase involved in cell wall biosynthesis
MKICYVLPQYNSNSSENFFHITNFLSELGKKAEVYLVIEHSNEVPKINNIHEIVILDSGIGHLSRFIKIVKIYFELYNKGVLTFFSRASLTGVLPLIVANRIINFNRANVVFWSCGQDVVPLSFVPTKKNFKRLVSKILAWASFKSVNYLATGPELMGDYYQKHFKVPKNKILILYNDISLERFYPISPQEKLTFKRKILGIESKVMLFVHTFNECRGIDLLPLIAKKIQEKNLNIIILAIGRAGDYSEKLNQKIEENDLQDLIFNLGEVANRNIVPYYQMADLFLMPSRGEGFPRVLLEAMATGCPSISFDVGGVLEILPPLEKANFVIDLDSEERFIDKSIELINNQEILDNLSVESYQKVKTYKTENIVEMYLNSLSEIEKT